MNNFSKERKVASFVDARYRDEIIDILRGLDNIKVISFGEVGIGSKTPKMDCLTREAANSVVRKKIDEGYSVFVLNLETEFNIFVAEAVVREYEQVQDIMIFVISTSEDIDRYRVSCPSNFVSLLNSSVKVLIVDSYFSSFSS